MLVLHPSTPLCSHKEVIEAIEAIEVMEEVIEAILITALPFSLSYLPSPAIEYFRSIVTFWTQNL